MNRYLWVLLGLIVVFVDVQADPLKEFFEKLRKEGQKVIGDIEKEGKKITGEVEGGFNRAFREVKSWTATAAGDVGEWGINAHKDVGNWVEDSGKQVEKWGQNTGSEIVGWAQEFPKELEKVWQEVVKGLDKVAIDIPKVMSHPDPRAREVFKIIAASRAMGVGPAVVHRILKDHGPTDPVGKSIIKFLDIGELVAQRCEELAKEGNMVIGLGYSTTMAAGLEVGNNQGVFVDENGKWGFFGQLVPKLGVGPEIGAGFSMQLLTIFGGMKYFNSSSKAIQLSINIKGAEVTSHLIYRPRSNCRFVGLMLEGGASIEPGKWGAKKRKKRQRNNTKNKPDIRLVDNGKMVKMLESIITMLNGDSNTEKVNSGLKEIYALGNSTGAAYNSNNAGQKVGSLYKGGVVQVAIRVRNAGGSQRYYSVSEDGYLTNKGQKIGKYEVFSMVWLGSVNSNTDKVVLRAHTKKYVYSSGDGWLRAEATSIGAGETFYLRNHGSGYYSLQDSRTNLYFYDNHQGYDGAHQRIHANRSSAGVGEKFQLIFLERMPVAIRNQRGKFLQVENDGRTRTDSYPGKNGSFVLVRMGKGKVAVQCANGKYLQAVNGGGGILRGIAPHIDIWEIFTMVPSENGKFALRTHSGHYVYGNEANAKASSVNSGELLSLVDLRGRIVSLATRQHHYLYSPNGGGGDVNARSRSRGAHEFFNIIDMGNKVAIRTLKGYYFQAKNGGGGNVNAHPNQIGGWETFILEPIWPFFYAFRSYNGHYLYAPGGGGGDLNARSRSCGAHEVFIMQDENGKAIYNEQNFSRLYKIVNIRSGKCLTVAGSHNAANVFQQSDRNHPSQWWQFRPHNYSSFMLINKMSGQGLDVYGARKNKAANVSQWPITGGSSQIWWLEYLGNNRYLIINDNSRKCLDVSGGSLTDGANVQQWDKTENDAEIWRFVPVISPDAIKKAIITPALQQAIDK